MEELIQFLNRIEHNLNGIEVKGFDNMSKLLCSIEAIRTLKQILNQPPAAPEQKEQEAINGTPGHIGGFDIQEQEVADGE